MNRQAVLAYANAGSTQEKIRIIRSVVDVHDHESLEAILTYIMEGTIPQAIPGEIKQVGKPRGMHARKTRA